ncbi:hypothetical protein AOQ84DRAFT_356975 [Glonium stellatum]|uniref:DUF7730 domain-containing protein n=1 Tax=Glonium stellatum TaxID=574774 RepID=A0A8E2ER42_9PEZI|nr:hypothetical protein AOQ84DRAFT_356975 [Glonium stellatum]
MPSLRVIIDLIVSTIIDAVWRPFDFVDERLNQRQRKKREPLYDGPSPVQRSDFNYLNLRRQEAAHFQPKPRSRSLTLPLPPSSITPGTKQRTLAQTKSTLITKLSTEIRLIIWEYALTDKMVHITQERKKLLNKPCIDTSDTVERHLDCCCASAYGDIWSEQNSAKLLPLLRTCRLVYSEAVDILYSRNTFRFEHLDTFIHFSTVILPSRFNSIRSLQIYWYFKRDIYLNSSFSYPPYDKATWEKACSILANIDALRYLTLTLGARSWHQTSKDKLLQSLMQIQPRKRFEVTVPWVWPGLEEVEREKLEGMPFTILHMSDLPA